MERVVKYIAVMEGEPLKVALDHYGGLDSMADSEDQALMDLEEGLPDFAEKGQKYFAVKVTFEKSGEEKTYDGE